MTQAFDAQTLLDQAVYIIRSRGQRSDARDLLRQIQEKVTDENDPIRVSSVLWDTLLTAQVNPRHAIERLETAIRKSEPVLGEDAPEVLECYRALAQCARVTVGTPGGGKPKAMKAVNTYIQRLERALGPDHPKIKEAVKFYDRVEKNVGLQEYIISL